MIFAINPFIQLFTSDKTLEISFHSMHLRNICLIQSYADEVLGGALSEKLISRLFDIKAIENVWELPVGRPVLCFQHAEEYIIIKLDSKVSMGFICVHAKPPKNEDDSIDWKAVRRIKLMFIGEEK